MAGNESRKNQKKEVVFYDEKKGRDDVVFSDSNVRADKRVGVSLEVSISGPHTFYSGFTMDISKGGLFVATHRLFPIGTELLLSLKIGSRTIEVLTTVVWVRDVNASEISGENQGMGLKFVSIDEESLELISEFILKKDPILYDTEL